MCIAAIDIICSLPGQNNHANLSAKDATAKKPKYVAIFALLAIFLLTRLINVGWTPALMVDRYKSHLDSKSSYEVGLCFKYCLVFQQQKADPRR